MQIRGTQSRIVNAGWYLFPLLADLCLLLYVIPCHTFLCVSTVYTTLLTKSYSVNKPRPKTSDECRHLIKVLSINYLVQSMFTNFLWTYSPLVTTSGPPTYFSKGIGIFEGYSYNSSVTCYSHFQTFAQHES